MSSRSSLIARRLERTRGDVAENSLRDKYTSLDESTTTSIDAKSEFDSEEDSSSRKSAMHNTSVNAKFELGIEENLSSHISTTYESVQIADESSFTRTEAILIAPDTPCFVHDPLRLDIPSIRLVEVLPLGEDGAIRCAIRHTTLHSTMEDGAGKDYTCLSYVWGPPTPTRFILMNGKPFKVRKNLWDFLRVNSPPALQQFKGDNHETHELDIKPWLQSIWIDALCIDQESVLERNHQVQQMGDIYSGATRVLSWMGRDPKITDLFAVVQKHVYYDWAPVDPRVFHPYCEEFCKSVYWKRAWVTQELLLARTLFMQARDIVVPLRRLDEVASRLNCFDPETHSFLRYLLINPILRVSCSLFENVELFCEKQCAVLSDRIYSLLSVSKDGTRLAVDYRCSPIQLARDVCHTTEKYLCLKRIAVVSEALQLDRFILTHENALPVISIDRDGTLESNRPCARCGKTYGAPAPPFFRVEATVRYICLCCQHFTRDKTMQAHSSAPFGVLKLIRQTTTAQIPDKRDNPQWDNAQLFWDGTGEKQSWREVKAPYKVISSWYGDFKTLALSFRAFRQIMSNAARYNASYNTGFSVQSNEPRDGYTSNGWRLTFESDHVNARQGYYDGS